MASYKIIKLLPEDYHKLSSIRKVNEVPSLEKKFYSELLSGNRLTFIYTENYQFLGEGSLVFTHEDPDFTILNQRVYLSRMIVKDTYRNRGIGSILLQYLIKTAKDLGYKEITIGVDLDNLNARHLYKKHGFTEVIFTGEDEYGAFEKLLKRL
ncbi:GNAT family N-acetyltransferase [Alkalicoccus daliensis]|uniref:Ribosomal protein S18 acetylase RimI n=1 Tax=Alkalicoccus daliensis TaxID=745820 RepID=A0A1H0D633_9BACI|nr:GNAT family N-acetyltransferase [Alkalicoccus daliensis]SDN65529.1 Ribosomal protein S18 acetylase RimI [Alkalicoccus daliensis]